MSARSDSSEGLERLNLQLTDRSQQAINILRTQGFSNRDAGNKGLVLLAACLDTVGKGGHVELVARDGTRHRLIIT